MTQSDPLRTYAGRKCRTAAVSSLACYPLHEPAAPQPDSEHFRFSPMTCPAVRWHADRAVIGLFLRPKEVDHERASCTAAAGSGSRHCGSRVLLGPGPHNHASV